MCFRENCQFNAYGFKLSLSFFPAQEGHAVRKPCPHLLREGVGAPTRDGGLNCLHHLENRGSELWEDGWLSQQ